LYYFQFARCMKDYIFRCVPHSALWLTDATWPEKCLGTTALRCEQKTYNLTPLRVIKIGILPKIILLKVYSFITYL
jgi:hypothetical protein